MRRVALGVALVAALILSLLAPVAQSDAASTATVRVQLQTPTGAAWHLKGYIATATRQTDGVYTETKTTSNGTGIFSLAPGTYVFRVATYRTDGGATGGAKYVVPVSADTVVTAGTSKTVGLRLYIGASISGTVRHSGTVVPNATVAVASADGAIGGYATTNAKGGYTITGVPSGKYTAVFNYRSWADPTVKPVYAYGWNYYGGTTLEKATYFQVYAQTSAHGATVKKSLNGSITAQTKAYFSLTTADKGGQIQIERFLPDKSYVQVDSVYGPVNSAGTGLIARVHATYAYRLAVKYGDTRFFYTGPGKTLSTDSDDAVLVTFSGATYHMRFGKKP